MLEAGLSGKTATKVLKGKNKVENMTTRTNPRRNMKSYKEDEGFILEFKIYKNSKRIP